MLRFRHSIGVTTSLLATKCVNKLKTGRMMKKVAEKGTRNLHASNIFRIFALYGMRGNVEWMASADMRTDLIMCKI